MTKHIVTTDDDPAIRKVLSIILKKAGYLVTACENGQELLDFLKKPDQGVDLLMLDIKMPGLSGFELLERVQILYPELPVVMLTAFNDLDTGMKAIRLGAADYLTKPIHQEALHTCLKRVLSESEKNKQQAYADKESLAIRKKLESDLRHAQLTLQQSTISTLEAFSETIEQKDPYTKGHCHRVRTIAMALGKAMNLSEEVMETLEGGSILHDIGKISIPEEILNKNGRLTKEEYHLIQSHPLAGEKIIAHLPMFKRYIPIVRSHHERVDGKGYPDGLTADQIPVEVRIVSLADAFDAMTSSRAYREALPTEIAVEELKLNAGSQFDPQLIDVFIEHELYLL